MSCLFACRKTAFTPPVHVPAPFTGCRVYQISQVLPGSTQPTVNTFTYNDDGTVADIASATGTYTGDNFEKKLAYHNGYVIITTYNDNNYYSKDSLVRNAKGRVIAIFHRDYFATSYNNSWDRYEYDSLNEVTYHINYNNGLYTSQNYLFEQGDMLWSNFQTDVHTYVYADTVYNVGNIRANIDDLVNYGMTINTPSKHLLSGLSINGVADAVYSYDLDSGGKITAIKELDGGLYTSTIQIAYTCE